MKRILSGALIAAAAATTFGVPPAQAAPARLPAKPPPGGAVQAVSHVVSDAEVKATKAYWTPARMKAATPLNSRGSAGISPLSIPTAAHYAGNAKVGALFSNNGKGGHFCTASVIDSPKGTMLVTAGHCLYNASTHKYSTKVLYVPKYAAGKSPYGSYAVRKLFLTHGWLASGDADLDFGFATVSGRVESKTGAFSLSANQPGYNHRVTVIGYPGKNHNSSDKPITCTVNTYKQSKYQMGFDCRGYYGGTSGSPWTMPDSSSNRTLVIGVIGGYQQGGNVDWRSYSAVFDQDILNLFGYAMAHA
ncbi:MAG: hypothetical protein JWN52_1037 [Actinomycetia bacterium]|nr:hypothetical protein [Actinomycetes bacterium]